MSWAAHDPFAWPRLRIAEAAALALLSLGITYVIFSDIATAYVPSVPLTFTILPFVIWAAARFRQRDVATLNATVCAVAIWFTLKGSGPFAQTPLNLSLLLLLAFMSTVVATGLVLNAAVSERRRAIDVLRNTLSDLREQTLRDPLTSLYNRRFLHDYLPRELVRAERERARLAVIMIDLDHFKQINDSAGHAAGDEVLVEIAALLKRHIRGSDIACRYGGEEFTLVLPNAALESARGRCDAIRSAVRKGRQKLLGITASFGVALFPAHAAEADALLRAADRALYEAKKAGRDQVRISEDHAASPRTRRRHLRTPDVTDG
jgi:diguanylate cyclase (GGDEF)-like protein